MKFKDLLYDFLITFFVAFIVSAAVTFVYNYLVHNVYTFDFSTPVRMALIFGIIFPWVHYRESKRAH
ncbi:MAG: hypothetical protein ACM3U0_01665 [archaeon]